LDLQLVLGPPFPEPRDECLLEQLRKLHALVFGELTEDLRHLGLDGNGDAR
jgi:hypothetical protein